MSSGFWVRTFSLTSRKALRTAGQFPPPTLAPATPPPVEAPVLLLEEAEAEEDEPKLMPSSGLR